MIKRKAKTKMGKKATADQLASLQDLIERYGENGPHDIPKGKFNPHEDWYPSRKNKCVLLQAFKAGQFRAYGFCQEFNGRPTFFITGFDRAKKQDIADQDILAAAGSEAVSVYEALKHVGEHQ